MQEKRQAEAPCCAPSCCSAGVLTVTACARVSATGRRLPEIWPSFAASLGARWTADKRSGRGSTRVHSDPRDEGRIVAAGALQPLRFIGTAALGRRRRRSAQGGSWTGHRARTRAGGPRNANRAGLILLTETAAEFFAHRGYRVIERVRHRRTFREPRSFARSAQLCDLHDEETHRLTCRLSWPTDPTTSYFCAPVTPRAASLRRP